VLRRPLLFLLRPQAHLIECYIGRVIKAEDPSGEPLPGRPVKEERHDSEWGGLRADWAVRKARGRAELSFFCRAG
jgi:hypothetical protein